MWSTIASLELENCDEDDFQNGNNYKLGKDYLFYSFGVDDYTIGIGLIHKVRCDKGRSVCLHYFCQKNIYIKELYFH